MLWTGGSVAEGEVSFRREVRVEGCTGSEGGWRVVQGVREGGGLYRE